MGIAEYAVADRISLGWIAEVVVPFGDGELAGHDGRAGAVAVVEDLEEVAAVLVADGCHAPVIEDEHVNSSKLGEQPHVAPVGVGEAQLFE